MDVAIIMEGKGPKWRAFAQLIIYYQFIIFCMITTGWHIVVTAGEYFIFATNLLNIFYNDTFT
jgi:hypothetical protein